MSAELTPESLAELRRLAEAATPGPWHAATGAALQTDAGDDATHVWYCRWRDERFLSIGKVLDNELDQTTSEDAAYIAAANPAVVLALLDAAAERDALAAERDDLRVWQERVALAAGIGDEVAGRGVHLEADPDAAAEQVAELLAAAREHDECNIYCGECGEPLAGTLCDHCYGSGCGPGTALGAYEECGWCAGAGKVHPDCAKLSYAELVAERDALAAKVERVRALHWPQPYADADLRAVSPSLPKQVCAHCRSTGDGAVPWPCPTARALDGGES